MSNPINGFERSLIAVVLALCAVAFGARQVKLQAAAAPPPPIIDALVVE